MWQEHFLGPAGGTVLPHPLFSVFLFIAIHNKAMTPCCPGSTHTQLPDSSGGSAHSLRAVY